MEQHERRFGQLVGGTVALRKIEDRRSGESGADCGGEGEVAFDRVGFFIDRNGVRLRQPRSLPCIGKSVNRHTAKSARNERGAQESLEIEDEVGCGLFF